MARRTMRLGLKRIKDEIIKPMAGCAEAMAGSVQPREAMDALAEVAVVEGELLCKIINDWFKRNPNRDDFWSRRDVRKLVSRWHNLDELLRSSCDEDVQIADHHSSEGC